MSRRERLRHLFGSPGELWLLARMTLFVGSLPLLLRLPLPRTLRWVDRLNPVVRARSPDAEERVFEMLGTIANRDRWSLRDNCVVRSLTAYAFLSSPEEPLELLFGVETEGGRLEGLGRRHVWCLRRGEPLRETEDVSRYAVVYRHPPAPAARGSG